MVGKPAEAMRVLQEICNIGGRLSGSDEEIQARSYIREYLAGLANGYLQSHDVSYEGWKSDGCWIEIDGKQYPAIGLPRGDALIAGGETLEIVDAGRGTLDELDRLADRLGGKAVVVTHEYMFGPDHIHRSKKFAKARALGVRLFVIANPDADTGLVSGGVASGLAGMGVGKETGDILRNAERAHFVLKSEHYAATTETIDWSLPAAPGAQHSEDEIVLCAHIDGHAPAESALDNASGVAVALALAKEFSEKNDLPCRLRVLIFSAEEFDLTGSAVYVKELPEDRRKKIRAVVNLDCVAGSMKMGVMTSGFQVLRSAAEKAAQTTRVEIVLHDPLVRNSDHYNFAIEGIPALRMVAGFGEEHSKLRNVLTEGDTRDHCESQEIRAAQLFSRELVEILSRES